MAPPAQPHGFLYVGMHVHYVYLLLHSLLLIYEQC